MRNLSEQLERYEYSTTFRHMSCPSGLVQGTFLWSLSLVSRSFLRVQYIEVFIYRNSFSLSETHIMSIALSCCKVMCPAGLPCSQSLLRTPAAKLIKFIQGFSGFVQQYYAPFFQFFLRGARRNDSTPPWNLSFWGDASCPSWSHFETIFCRGWRKTWRPARTKMASKYFLKWWTSLKPCQDPSTSSTEYLESSITFVPLGLTLLALRQNGLNKSWNDDGGLKLLYNYIKALWPGGHCCY